MRAREPVPDPALDPDLTLTERVMFERLGWFVEVRWAAGAAALLFMALGWYVFEVRFLVVPAVLVILGLFFYNAFFSLCARMLYLKRRIRRTWIRRLAHAQIACDLLAVAVLVHFIGGVENHFIVLFIFPMVVASEFFRARIAYVYATIAAVLINLIGWGEYFFGAAHAQLLVGGGDGSAARPLVDVAGAHRATFVLQVCFVMTFAVYVTVFVATSIADRLRRRENELQAAYRELRSLEQVKSQFMRKTSHELRAPVGALQSLLKAALKGLPAEAAGRDLVDRAADRTENMMDLIDDLLRYSRLRAAELRERFEPVELAEVVRSAVELLRPRAEEGGIELELAAASAVIRGARDSLTDLVNNLVSNAIRYTPAGGRVSVSVGPADGGGAALVVADTGIGIPPDEVDHVFDEFYRGRDAKRTVAHGTGLGLTIVRRVIDTHHGSVRIESAAGRGTTFRVFLPDGEPAS